MKTIKTLFILLLVFALSFSSSDLLAQQDKQPNFLFIISDDQSFNALRAYGNQEIQTPNLDKLAEQGVSFTHTYNQGSWSGAVCVASRTMLITGQTVFKAPRNKSTLVSWAVTKDPVETNVKLWGEVLQEGGYETFMTGKWHNSDEAALRNFQKAKAIGWGMYETFDKENSNKFAYGRPKKTDWTPWNKQFKGHWSPKVKDIILDENGSSKMSKNYTVHQHSTGLYSDQIIHYLMQRDQNAQQPFFAFVAFNAPHDPRQAPMEYVDMYPLEQVKVPSNYLPEHPFDQGDNRVRDELLAPFPRTEEAVQLHKQEYYAIISHMDKELGRILEALEKSGQADNTYVIFTSDHGLAVGSHGLMGKQNQYDHSVRVPFIIKGPNLAQGKKINEMIYMQSAYATTCELAGLKVPETVEFQSLVKLMNDENAQGEEYIFGSYLDLQRMIRSERYKLIVYPKVNRIQLFDLLEDPNEIHDLSESRKHRSTIKKLHKILVEKQRELGDALILENL